MIKAYKYKLDLTVKQKKQLAQNFGCVRFIYNWGLNIKKTKYEDEKITLSCYDLDGMMTKLKKEPEYKWLNNAYSVCLKEALRNLDTAYNKFFKEKQGFPKFKSKKNPCNSATYRDCKFDFENNRLYIPKIGKVRFFKNRSFDVNNCKICTVTISKDSCCNYWASAIVEDYKDLKDKVPVKDNDRCVGIDLGVKNLCILDNGTKYDNPKYYKKYCDKLARLQQILSGKTKDSNNYNKLKLRIAKLSKKIQNMRNDYLHKTSTELINNYDTICIETLNVKGMMKNHHLAQAIGDVSLGEFNRQLTYKGEWYGKNIIHIGRWEPSSKTCNKCGYVNKDLELKDREWVCPVCGEYHDRDINAAINIRKIGLEISK